jgi:hypothetical protein
MLLFVVMFIAIALAATRFANWIWTTALFTLEMLVLWAAGLGAIFANGRRRAFCAGLFLSGAAYALTITWFNEGDKLATTQLLFHLNFELHKTPYVPPPGSLGPWPRTAPGTMVPGPGYHSGIRAGHSLFGLLFGLAGGAIAREFWLRRSDSRSGGLDNSHLG